MAYYLSDATIGAVAFNGQTVPAPNTIETIPNNALKQLVDDYINTKVLGITNGVNVTTKLSVLQPDAIKLYKQLRNGSNMKLSKAEIAATRTMYYSPNFGKSDTRNYEHGAE